MTTATLKKPWCAFNSNATKEVEDGTVDDYRFRNSDQFARNAGRSYSHCIQLLFEPLLIHQGILRKIVDCGRGDWIGAKLFDLRDPRAVRDRALVRRQQLPARETLHSWDDELCAALEGKTDERTFSLLLATMLDGFPRGMVPNIRTYIEGVTLVLGGHSPSPEILAAAIVRNWRKDKFPPTIAGLLEECDRARQGVLNARRLVGKMIVLLDNAEEILCEARVMEEGREGEG